MGLRDFVQPGRVCFVNYGEDYGKLVVIVDMLDINRVLVDSTNGKMPRVIYPIKRLSLTKLKVDKVQRGCRTGTLKKLAKDKDIDAEFKKTPASIKMEKYAKRKTLTDFERFKVMVLRKQKSFKSGHLNMKEPEPKKKKVVEQPPPPSPSKKGKDIPPSPGKKGNKK